MFAEPEQGHAQQQAPEAVGLKAEKMKPSIHNVRIFMNDVTAPIESTVTNGELNRPVHSPIPSRLDLRSEGPTFRQRLSQGLQIAEDAET